MNNIIRPRTYNDILRLKKCLALKTYIPEMDEQLLNKLYNFIADPLNKVSVSDGMISFIEGLNNNLVDTVKISIPRENDLNFYNIITLSALSLNITRPYIASDGGDSGIGSNNNNNNNNNNG